MSFIFTESIDEPAFLFTDYVDINGVLNSSISGQRVEISDLPVVMAGDGGFTANPSSDGIVLVGGEIRIDIESLTQAL